MPSSGIDRFPNILKGGKVNFVKISKTNERTVKFPDYHACDNSLLWYLDEWWRNCLGVQQFGGQWPYLALGRLTRTYDLYVPAGLPSTKVPLVIVLHGGTQNADIILGVTPVLPGYGPFAAPWVRLLALADTNKFIVVAPNGTNDPSKSYPFPQFNFNDGASDATSNYAKQHAIDDVGFINALIANLSGSYNIDPSRIYSCGTSNGGMMSMRLAQKLSNKIAAIGAVACNEPTMAVSAGYPSRPVSVIHIKGTRDPIIPYNGGSIVGGGGTVISTADTLKFWIAQAGCSPTPTSTYNVPDINTTDGSPLTTDCTVSVATYGNGREGTEVMEYTVTGGGHTEPSILYRYSDVLKALGLGPQDGDMETADEVWNFLQRHAIPAPSITSFSPTSGGGGTTVTISGRDFLRRARLRSDSGEISAGSFTVNSSGQITAAVGTGATGRVSVTTPIGTASSASDFSLYDPDDQHRAARLLPHLALREHRRARFPFPASPSRARRSLPQRLPREHLLPLPLTSPIPERSTARRGLHST